MEVKGIINEIKPIVSLLLTSVISLKRLLKLPLKIRLLYSANKEAEQAAILRSNELKIKSPIEGRYSGPERRQYQLSYSGPERRQYNLGHV